MNEWLQMFNSSFSILFFFLLYFDENFSMFILKEKIGSFQGGLASLLNEGKVV